MRLFWLFVGDEAKRHLFKAVKHKGVLAYLRALQFTRRVFLIIILSILFLQLMMISLVGALVTGFLLWDHDFQTKMEILFWIFVTLFTLPAIGVGVLLSERLWFKFSGAEKMLKETT